MANKRVLNYRSSNWGDANENYNEVLFHTQNEET